MWKRFDVQHLCGLRMDAEADVQAGERRALIKGDAASGARARDRRDSAIAGSLSGKNNS